MIDRMVQTLKITELSKRFGQQIILDHITARFEGGKIYGVVGQNGCGKTVLLKCVCGLLPPDHGTVALLSGSDEIPKKGAFGAVIETPGFLPQFSGFENLRMLAMLTPGVSKDAVRNALMCMGLSDVANKKVGKYSLGMRQRLGIAQAIMGDPPVLLLDEPLNGLDQKSVESTYLLLRRFRESGKMMILASHHQQDIDLLCDEVFELKSGSLFPRERNAANAAL